MSWLSTMSGDIPDAVTSLGGGKCESTSVIDLFLACPRAFQRIQSLQVGGKLVPKADHLAVTLTMNKSAKTDEVVQGVAASNNELLSTERPSFDAGQEFIMDPHLMPAFVEQLTAAAPLLEQICTTASTAAESRNADLLNSAVASYIKVISDACLASGMKIKGVKTDKDRWLRKVTRIPPSVATREQRKAFKREHKKGMTRCDVAECFFSCCSQAR